MVLEDLYMQSSGVGTGRLEGICDKMKHAIWKVAHLAITDSWVVVADNSAFAG